MTRPISAALSLTLLFGCGDATDFVGVEDVGESDLRVVVARTEAVTEVRMLTREQPFRFRAEPLSEVLGRGDALRIWVLAYRVADLEAAFPALAGRTPAELVEALAVRAQPSGPGRYAPPEPARVLSAVVDSGSGEDVEYERRDWAAVRDARELDVSFELAGNLACPPVGAALRVFSREDPGTVCLYTRNAGCIWARGEEAGCANGEAVFGPDLEVAEPAQLPDGRLDIGGTTCEAVAPRTDELRGETHAWRCGDRVVAAQQGPVLDGGDPWRPVRGPQIQNPEIVRGGDWAPSSPGLLFAGTDDGGDVYLRRLSVKAGAASVETVQHPVVDAPDPNPRSVSSPDGVVVDIDSGSFGANVGVGGEQCFRLVQGGLPERWAQIDERISNTRITLMSPGVGVSLDRSFGWQVVGDPGPDFTLSPDVDPVRLPADSGALLRLSSRSEDTPLVLAIRAEDASFAFRQVTRVPGQRRLYHCPTRLEHPADLVGDVIVGATGFFALEASGLRLLTSDGAAAESISAAGTTFSADFTVTRVRAQGRERVVAYRDDVAHVFDPNERTHERVQLEGPIRAVLDGPNFLVQVPGRPRELRLVDPTAGDPVRVLIPAFDEAQPAPIRIQARAAAGLDGRTLIGFTAGAHAGVLDRLSGLSSAVRVGPNARVEALMTDEGSSEIWAVVYSDDGVELVRLPLPPPS